MGYYVTGEGSITIPAENLDAAYDALVELNRRDDLKTGGRYGGAPTSKPANSASVSDSPDKWFSWMDWNYDEIFTDAKGILKAVGFEIYDNEGEYIVLRYYDDKIGAEEHFVRAIAAYVEPESEMVWTGEDGEKWRWVFENGEMIVQQAIITWD